MGDTQNNTSSLGKDFALSHGASKIDAGFSTPKIAIGEVFVIENDRIEPSQQDREKKFGSIPAELDAFPADVQDKIKADFIQDHSARYHGAYERTLVTYNNFIADAGVNAPLEVRDIAVESLETELALLEDPSMQRKILAQIASGDTAEVAIDSVYENAINGFRGMDNAYFRKTVVELEQHRAVMQHHLHPDKILATLDNIKEGTIVVSSTLPLSALSDFEDEKTGKPLVRGVITDAGSLQSHASILIQSMGIPYARIGKNDLSRMKNGDKIIMDGETGSIVLHPNKEIIAQYSEKIAQQNDASEKLLTKFEKKKTLTSLDGQKVNIHANFALSNEAHALRSANPAGIGLYRTEITVDMRGGSSPTPEVWKDILKENMSACALKDGDYLGTTVRTIDIAGDKSDLPQEEREAKQADITKVQMTALALLQNELSDEGYKSKLKVMIPMISSSEHMQQMQGEMDEQAKAAGVKSIKLGCMVEVPALLAELDTLDTAFMSVGSNDLIHSILGIDRYDKESITKYDPTHPAVLKALKSVTDAGEERGIPVSICGNMASNPKYTALLLGAGFRNLSCGIDSIPMVKEVASRTDIPQAQALFAAVLKATTREERKDILRNFNDTHLGLGRGRKLDLAWQPPAASPDVSSDIS